MLSAIFTITTCIVSFRIMRDLFEVNSIIAFCVVLTTAFTRIIWSQSIIAEVYTLNLLYVSLVLYFFITWNRTMKDKYFYLGVFFYAISFGNHLTMITFLLSVVYLVIATDKKAFLDLRKVIFVISFIIIGACQYIYLLWVSQASNSPVFLEHSVKDFESFWMFVTGTGLKANMFSMPFSAVVSVQLPAFFQNLYDQFSLLLPVAGVGFYKLGVRNRLNLFLFLGIIGNVFLAINYNIPDIFVYYMPTYLIVGIYIAIGFNAIFCYRDISRFKWLPVILVTVPIMMVTANFHFVNQHDKTEYANNVEDVLNVVNSNALIISTGDYHYDMFFQYYLLGEDYQKNNNIFLIRFDPQQIMQYISSGTPLALPGQKIMPPGGLSVYCIDETQLQGLQDAGLKLTGVGDGVAVKVDI